MEKQSVAKRREPSWRVAATNGLMNLMEASRHRVAGELRTEVENKRDRVRRDGEEARARRRRDREDEKLDVVVVVLSPPWVSNFYEPNVRSDERSGERKEEGEEDDVDDDGGEACCPFGSSFQESKLLIEGSNSCFARFGFSQLKSGCQVQRRRCHLFERFIRILILIKCYHRCDEKLFLECYVAEEDVLRKK